MRFCIRYVNIDCMNWDNYRYFIEIYRTGSLKKAARKLGVNQTTAGRNLSALEAEVGTRLFERRSDGFVVTAAGTRILGAIQQTEETMLGVERLLSGKDERPEGIVKIAAPGALANHWLIPRLSPFIKLNPQVELQFLTGPELVNLARREADIALRLVKPKQSGLVLRRAGTMKLSLFGSEKLFSRTAIPKMTADIHRFPFIGLFPDVLSEPESDLLKKLGKTRPPSVKSAAWSSVYSAITAGLGIGILPSFMTAGNAGLVPILPEMAVSVPIWIVYHPDLRNAARVRVVLDYLSILFEKDF